MSDSESNQMDEQTMIYEEQQVLWAKIRGYPWWPAFVDKVHGAKCAEDDQVEYTVFFFGDNTHSRLGGSKLRRFLDYYTQFFPKAKTNRKLYMSIMKAEQKLKQNGGNVEIFQTLRNSMKKPKKGKGHHKTQSIVNSEDHANNMSEQPELIRHKTFPNNQQKSENQNQSQQPQALEQSKQRPRRKGKKVSKPVEKEEKQQKQDSQKIVQPSESQSEKNQQNEAMKQQQQLPKVLNYRTRSGRVKKQVMVKVEDEQQQKQEEQKQESSQSQKQQPVEPQKKNYVLRVGNKTKLISRNQPKKRGRPKKVIQQQNDQQQDQSQQIASSQSQNKQPQPILQPNQQQRRSRQQRTTMRAPTNNQEQQKKQQTSEQNRQLILERVKFCIDKRSELIEYLDQLNVNTDIVKEILDLDVTTVILEGGQQTVESIRVLQKLKSALLHKYFPDDIKIRKKYEKITKKAQSLKTNGTQNEQTLQDLELRRKTIVKLQKILRSIDQSIDQKQRAIQIESYFRKYDQTIDNGYKTIAYNVLRSLKDKNHSIEEIMNKLENGDFDEEKDLGK